VSQDFPSLGCSALTDGCVCNMYVCIGLDCVYMCIGLDCVYVCIGLDGSTSGLERERLINLFNAEDNDQIRIFLLSTRYSPHVMQCICCLCLCVTSFR